MDREILKSSSIEETAKIASTFAKYGERGGVIALYGNLGTGKTLFSRSLISELSGENIDVTSPTFNLVQLYDSSDGLKIYHFDLYRLKSEDEIYELGIEDAFFSGFSIIEWPEIIQHLLPENTIHIKLTRGEDENSRVIEVIHAE